MNRDKKKILFYHHGGAFGGAPLCLLDVMRGLRKAGVECVVCCRPDSTAALDFFGRHGFATMTCELTPFQHTTLGHYSLCNPFGVVRLARWVKQYATQKQRFLELIQQFSPDLVYFNSLVLAPYATVPASTSVASIVHVREPVLNGVVGLRRSWLRKHLIKYARKVISISQDNLDRLNLPAENGTVIYDFVDFSTFNHTLEKQRCREELGIPRDAKVALFAGGSIGVIKGRDDFLKAMAIVKLTTHDLYCLMPSFNPNEFREVPPGTLANRLASSLGYYRRKQAELDRLIISPGLNGCIYACPFRFDIEKFIAASDVVCVPHIKPHCSLTINQSGAMKRPVVAYRIGGVEEMVQHGRTGLLVDKGDVAGLAESVVRLFNDPNLGRQLGEGGYLQALERFESHAGTEKILTVIRDVLR